MRQTEPRERWEVLAAVFRPHGVAWALTGADAALFWTDFFQAAETEIYANPLLAEEALTGKALMAQPARYKGNLRVIEPPVPAAIPKDTAATPVAPLLLVYAELRFTATDQAAEAADMLLPKLLAETSV